MSDERSEKRGRHPCRDNDAIGVDPASGRDDVRVAAAECDLSHLGSLEDLRAAASRRRRQPEAGPVGIDNSACGLAEGGGRVEAELAFYHTGAQQRRVDSSVAPHFAVARKPAA